MLFITIIVFRFAYQFKQKSLMATVITISNSKGGVAKTASTASIASILAEKGYKVLCIDVDFQGDLRTRFREALTEINIYDILMENQPFKAKAINTNLAIIPASERLTKFEKDYKDKNEMVSHQNALKDLLQGSKLYEHIDFILIDTPPNIADFCVLNAYVASDYILIPSELSPNSDSGIDQIKTLVTKLNKLWNPNLKLLGAFVVKYRGNLKLHNTMYDEMLNKHNDLLLNTKIRHTVEMEEISAKGVELIHHDDEKLQEKKVKIKTIASCVVDYRSLVDELLIRINNK